MTITAAERELRRAEESRKHEVISLQDYEKARDDVDKARLEYEHARHNARLESESLAFELRTRALERDRQKLLVQNLERRVEELGIRSTVDGMIGTLSVDQKAAVTRNQPLMTVVDLTAFEIEIQVPEAYADDLGLGMQAEVTFGLEAYPGTITAISPEVQNSQVTGRVRFAGEVPEGLRQNQRVSARIILESKPDTVLVQRGPFVDSGGGRVAYVVSDGLARRRPIRIGSTSIGQVEVLDGLAPGDTIIITNLAQFQGAETVFLSD